MSTTEIAQRFSISRQRVDQILKRHGGISAQQARRIRGEQKQTSFTRAVDSFIEVYGATIRNVADSGVARLDVEQKFAVLLPDTPRDVIRAGIRASGVDFDYGREDIHFGPLVVEAAVWYVLARIHKLSGNVETALRELSAEEMVAVADALKTNGVPAEAATSVLLNIASARVQITEHPTLTLAKKEYDAERSAAVRDLGLQSDRGLYPWPPTSQTISKRLGDGYWADALRKIGITPSDKGRPRGLVVFDESDYTASVKDFLQHCEATGSPKSFDAFEVWIRNEERAGRRRPSGPSTRLYYGSWINAKRSILTGERPAASQLSTSTVAATIARTAFHDAGVDLRQAIDRLASASVREVPELLTNFIRNFMTEFEVRRRHWIRSMVLRDPDAARRRLAGPRLPRQQYEVTSGDSPDVGAALTDRYLDSMLVGPNGISNVDGWLDARAQQELDVLNRVDKIAAQVLRELRNFFTHESTESTERLRKAVEQLVACDPTFAMNAPLTRRTLTQWLTVGGATRLERLCSAVLAAWRAMMAAEAGAD